MVILLSKTDLAFLTLDGPAAKMIDQSPPPPGPAARLAPNLYEGIPCGLFPGTYYETMSNFVTSCGILHSSNIIYKKTVKTCYQI